MRLDAAQLAAEAEAKETRMRSAAWADTGHHDENWVASLTQGDVLDPESVAISAPAVSARRTRASSRPAVAAERREPLHQDLAPTPAAPVDLGEITAQLDAMGHSLRALSEGMARLRAERPVAAEDVPTWLRHAAGDPLTYDAPDPSRMTVCVRVLPAHYARLQQVQARLGLRTVAGAWEYILRLGTTVADRININDTTR